VVSVKTLWSVADTQQRVSGMTQDYQPTLIAAMDLNAALKETTTAMGFYLLTLKPDYLQSYEDNLLRLDSAIVTLQQTSLARNDAEVAAIVDEVAALLVKYESYKAKLMPLAQNVTENFSALGYAGSNINPISREMLQAISNMLLSEQQEPANGILSACFSFLTSSGPLPLAEIPSAAPHETAVTLESARVAEQRMQTRQVHVPSPYALRKIFWR
ncbi:MAG: hypothetical protein P8Z74_20630, partial [Acidobacteriota bacterium]